MIYMWFSDLDLFLHSRFKPQLHKLVLLFLFVGMYARKKERKCIECCEWMIMIYMWFLDLGLPIHSLFKTQLHKLVRVFLFVCMYAKESEGNVGILVHGEPWFTLVLDLSIGSHFKTRLYSTNWDMCVYMYVRIKRKGNAWNAAHGWYDLHAIFGPSPTHRIHFKTETHILVRACRYVSMYAKKGKEM